MNEDLIIKAAPIMTQEQIIEKIGQLDRQVSSFLTSYNSRFFGNKEKVDGKVIMSKGRQEVGGGDNILILDAQNPTYRMWAGKADETLAPFRVTKEGLLYAGGALLTGHYSGAVIGTAMESGWNSSAWTVASGATGVYTVTHSLGHTNYIVVVSALATNVKECSVSARNTNDFVIKIANNVGALEANDFFFELILKS